MHACTCACGLARPSPSGALRPTLANNNQNTEKRHRPAAVCQREQALDTGQSESVLAGLSSEYYSLIPTACGFKKPPTINTHEMFHQKEELLKFWLRMGFDEMGEDEEYVAPIEGVMDLPLPPSLQASGIPGGIPGGGQCTGAREEKRGEGRIRGMGSVRGGQGQGHRSSGVCRPVGYQENRVAREDGQQGGACCDRQRAAERQKQWLSRDA